MNQSIKAIALVLVFTSLATMALGIIPRASASSVPTTGNMLIKIYLDPSQEEAALQTGDIDINDWPLSSTFISSNAANPAITLNNYAEIGKFEFDLNNQWWPTGPNDPTHSTVGPRAPQSSFFNPTGVRDLAALHFRRAIAHLSNKAKYTTDFMGGYGYVLQTPMPVPALESYTDYTTLTNATAQADPYSSTGGYIYTYSRAAAIQEFELGGFVIASGRTVRTWFSIHDTLSAAIGSNVTVLPIVSTTPASGFATGQTIQIGEGNNPGVETATIASVTATSLTITAPTTHPHAAGEPVVAQTPLVSGEALPNMKFWIRLDDPNRRQAGQDLYSEMLATGIPAASALGAAGLDERIAERDTCFTEVMINYDYNIYTGGWSLAPDPDFLFDLYHSSMGQYSWANNYAGFQNHEYDPFAAAVKYPVNSTTARFEAIQAEFVAEKYIPIIELWATKSVKGYRTGWTGVVNEAGYGTDNTLSLAMMNWTDGAGNSRSGPANTIVYGFKSDISALNALTSEWLWDWNVLNQIYDTLISRNPYDLAEEVGNLATQWNTSTTYPGWVGKTVTQFTLRTDATFHNGDPVTPADVAYSILAVKAAGAGNAWNYPEVFNVDHIQIKGQIIRIFWNVQSAWALHWAGFLPIIDENLWNQAIAIGPGSPSGYNGFITKPGSGNYTAGTYVNAANIRVFQPQSTTDAAGHLFLTDDGSWAWSFVSYSFGNNVALKASLGMYATLTRKFNPAVESYQAMSLGAFINAAFHGIGNVNYSGGYGAGQGWYSALDNVISIIDLSYVANSLTVSSTTLPWGPGAGQYNPDADFQNTGTVNIIDLVITGAHFGQKSG